jgi:hypothetical protein
MNKKMMPIVVMTLALCMQGYAQSVPVTLYSISDSYLYQGSPNSNYGTLTTGIGGQGDTYPGYFYDIVVTFNISSLNGTTIDAAFINFTQTAPLYTEFTVPQLVFSCFKINASSWVETAVTWNNPPVALGDYYVEDYQDNNIYNIIVPADTVLQTAIDNGEQLFSTRCTADGYGAEMAGIFWTREYASTDPTVIPQFAILLH